MRVMGIDPGLRNLGWSVLDGEKLVASGTIRSKPTDGEHNMRVWIVFAQLLAIVHEYDPAETACEDFECGETEDVRYADKGTNRIIGAVTTLTQERPVRFYLPQVWQRSILGRSMGDGKAGTRRIVNLILQGARSLKTNHEVDATGVALHHQAVRRMERRQVPHETARRERKAG